MRHLRARRLLAALPDGALAPVVEAQVREHAASCARCQRLLAEYAALDRVLRSLPRRLVEPAPEAELVLRRLALAAPSPRGAWIERFPIHPVGAVATALALLAAVILLTPPFEMETAEPFNVVVVARATPPSPRVERQRRVSTPSEPAHREHTAESFLIPVVMR